jgi:hypothetical protein
MKMKQIINYYIWILLIIFIYSCEQTNEPIVTPLNISVGNNYNGEIKEIGKIDRFFLDINSTLYVHIVCVPLPDNPNFHPEIKIFEPQNKLIGEDKNQIRAVIQSLKLSPGITYEIQVKEWGDNEIGKYKLWVEIDPDDDKLISSDIDFYGELQYIRDVDYYNVQPIVNGNYHISVIKDATNPNLHPELTLYYLNTSIKTNKTQNETVLSNLTLSAGLTYQLRVKEWGDNEARKYHLTFLKDRDDSLYYYSSTFIYEGIIDFYGDQDRIYFNPPSSGNYNISLKPKVTNSGYHPAIELYKSDNTQIWTAVSQTECKISGLNLQGTNYYRFNIHDWGDDVSGHYILSVEKQ